MRRLIAGFTFLPLCLLAVAPASAHFPRLSAGASTGVHTSRTRGHFRAFTRRSYWNRPLDAHGRAPVAPHSAEYIRDSRKTAHTRNYLNLVASDWSTPVYYAQKSDPIYTITPTNHPSRSVTLHIPNGAKVSSKGDHPLVVFDRSRDQVVGLWKAAFSGGEWTAAGFDRYYLDSEGLAQKVGGTTGNVGHRGVSAAVRVVRRTELKSGAINHRLSCEWWATGVKYKQHYFPMYEDEGDQGGIVPEGIVVRIRPRVHLKGLGLGHRALIIAKALKRYGCVVGDNSGSGNNLKVQAGVNIPKDALAAIPWRRYQFVKGGYNPVTGRVRTP